MTRQTHLREVTDETLAGGGKPAEPVSLPEGDNKCRVIKKEEQYIHLFDYYVPTKQKWIRKTCKRADCDNCNRKHNPIIYRRIKHFVEGYSDRIWFFITLSTTNKPTIERSYEDLRIAWNAWRKRASKIEAHPWNQIEHWISVIEIKFTRRKLYNVHRHILCASKGPRLDYKQFHNEWNLATGLPHAHCNIKKLQHPIHASIEYLSKYMSKDSQKLNDDFMKGRRRVTSSKIPPKAPPSRYGYCCMAQYIGDCNHPYLSDPPEIYKRDDSPIGI